MMTRSLLSLAACAALLAATGCGRRASTERSGAATPAATGTAGAAAILPITAAGIHERVAASGAPTLVNVWATWCGPCRDEFPELMAVANAHRADGLRLMLVSADFEDQRQDVERFLAAHGVRDTTWIKTGDDQAFLNGLHPRWTGAIPVTMVYDRHGTLVAFWEGRADSSQFETAVSRAFAAAPLQGARP